MDTTPFVKYPWPYGPGFVLRTLRGISEDGNTLMFCSSMALSDAPSPMIKQTYLGYFELRMVCMCGCKANTLDLPSADLCAAINCKRS